MKTDDAKIKNEAAAATTNTETSTRYFSDVLSLVKSAKRNILSLRDVPNNIFLSARVCSNITWKDMDVQLSSGPAELDTEFHTLHQSHSSNSVLYFIFIYIILIM